MLRFVHALVFALAASFGIASGAHAWGSETALRGNFERCHDRVGALALEAFGTRQQTASHATAVASECSYAARGAPKLLTAGAYRAEQFASQKLLDSHFAKHAAEWGAGSITKSGYLQRAQDLLGRGVGGDILGAARANGDVLRYNLRTNEFAIGTAEGSIRTLFRPERGIQYWLEQVSGL